MQMYPFLSYLKNNHIENIKKNKKIIFEGHWGISGVYIRNKWLAYKM